MGRVTYLDDCPYSMVDDTSKWKLGMVGVYISRRTGEYHFYRISAIDRERHLLTHTPITKDEYLEAVREDE